MLLDFYRQFTLKMSAFPTYLLGGVMCYRIKNLIGTHQKTFFTIFPKISSDLVQDTEPYSHNLFYMVKIAKYTLMSL